MKDMYDFMKTFDMHTIIVVGVAFFWLNEQLKEIRNDIQDIKKEVAVIKTVLVMKNIMPAEMTCKEEK